MSHFYEFPEKLYVIVATDDDGLTAINYFAASSEAKDHTKHFPSREIMEYRLIGPADNETDV